MDRPTKYADQLAHSLPADCDYLIVGAGTAGCTLANRLSESSSNRVVLLEAGPADDSWLIRTPAAVGALLNHPRFNWNYRSDPQTHLANRSIPLPRGRVVGGTSSINGMVYIRGHALDYQQWSMECGEEWDFAHVLPYFIRSENNLDYTDPAYHGTSGPMRVSHVSRRNPLISRFIAAACELGYPRREDFNTGELEGFGARQGTLRDGRRESMATAFLRPALHRPNLIVATQTRVRRLLFEGKRVCGVELDRHGVTVQLRAHRETLVCAGAFDSPALLMRSGIGDANDLQEWGITPKFQSPEVGRNLTDHLCCSVAVRTDNTESYGLTWRTVPRSLWNLAEYLLARRGPLASNVIEAHGFIRSRPELTAPDLQIIFLPAYRNPSGFPIPFAHGYGINVALLTPRSRGRVSLSKEDPQGAPRVDPQFLSDPEDLPPLLVGLKVARRLLRASPFRDLRGVELAPGSAVQDDVGLTTHVRNTSATVFHPVSTCRMGRDANAVVDPELRVRGVDRLRVIDASVFPRIVRGNTNAAVVMVAEKAADMILGRRGLVSPAFPTSGVHQRDQPSLLPDVNHARRIG
jgi:choline dehydrogenase